MRGLLENQLHIPVIQMELPNSIAGATLSSNGHRGIVVNVRGNNENVLVRRSTLAHELGHLLWDPDQHLKNLVVDDSDSIERWDEEPNSSGSDYVEARANAFAVEFLAPRSVVLDVFTSEQEVRNGLRAVMERFGISFSAARFQIFNASDRKIDFASLQVDDIKPSVTWLAAEDYTLDFFKPRNTPISRRGRFAYEIVSAVKEHRIHESVAASWLQSSIDEYRDAIEIIQDLYHD